MGLPIAPLFAYSRTAAMLCLGSFLMLSAVQARGASSLRI
jgi:SHS family lactate transporter-like MFS transporter